MLTPSGQSAKSSPGLQLLFLIAFSFALAAVMANLPFLMSTLLVAGIVVFIACFVSTQFGLYLLIFSMLLSPEFGAGGLGGSSETSASRGVTVRLEDLLLLILGFAWLARMAVHKDTGLVRDNPLNGPIAYYIAVIIVTTLIGFMAGNLSGKTGFFFVLKYIEYFVVYFIVFNNIEDRSQIERFTVALLATAVVVSVVAIGQIPGGGRVSAPFEGESGEPNTLGGYLVLMSATAGGLMLHLKGRIKFVLGGLVLLFIIPLIFTQSRGS